MVSVTILDGYVDEPTCLGVPPYLSPYPRYAAGAIWNSDPSAHITYLTIDQLRQNAHHIDHLAQSDLLVVIAGVSVPGRYLSGFPASPRELTTFLQRLDHPLKVLYGPAAKHGFGGSGGTPVKEASLITDIFDIIIKGDIECVLEELIHHRLHSEGIDPSTCRSHADRINKPACQGATIASQHPGFPDLLIAEIETYRGCPRSITGGCSFCSEPLKGSPQFRSIQGIIDEIEQLYKVGVRHFRLGNQPCIFSYMAHDAKKSEFPRPNPEALERLFIGIRAVAPKLHTLHVDNANPGILARYPEECRRIAQIIVQYHTPGDVAALGMESADPAVIRANNLKATPDEVYRAVTLLNEVGSKRGKNGMPEFLPGLNFLFGLKGETKQTFTCDLEFLQRLFHDDLLLRRINLRQLIPLPRTPLAAGGTRIMKKHRHLFQQFKRQVQQEIERPLLQRLLPQGIVLEDVVMETYKGKVTFGRQLGSYPLLVGVPGRLPLRETYRVKVVDYGFRSITAVPFPLKINTAQRETIEALPGIGQKRAIRLLHHRPFYSNEEILASLDDQEIGRQLLDYITL
jgi:radical SAM superfamily enzyme with C-terminal helix-hairpin-helix motif